MTWGCSPSLNDGSTSAAPARSLTLMFVVLQSFQAQEMLGMYGRSPTSYGNYYIATGDSGQIMTHGALAGMIISGRLFFLAKALARAISDQS